MHSAAETEPSSGGAVQLLSFHWADVWSGRCPDLVLSFLVNGEARVSRLLVNHCGDEAAAARRFSLLPEGDTGLQQLQGFTAGVALFLDLDSDHDLDLCHYQCSSPSSRGGCHTAPPCTLQCALNSLYSASQSEAQNADVSAQGLQPRSTPVFSLLRPLGDADLSLSAAAAVSTAALALDWNSNSWPELLLLSSAPEAARHRCVRPGWTSIELLPNGAAGLADGAAPRCARAVNDSSPADAGCKGLLAVTEVELAVPSAGCRSLLLADVDWSSGSERHVAELLCFGRRFPDDVQVYRQARASGGRLSPQPQLRPALSNPPPRPLLVRQVCVGDLNGDGRPDVALATENDGLQLGMSDSHARSWTLTLLRPNDEGADGSSKREDTEEAAAGEEEDVTAAGGSVWSVTCLDADNDGHLDVLALHSLPSGAVPVLYYNELHTRGRFTAVVLRPPELELAQPEAAAGDDVSASLAVADWDDDGWLDVAVGHRSGLLQLYRNTRRHQRGQQQQQQAAGQQHWLEVTLYGQHGGVSSSDGAVVTLHWEDGQRQSRVVSASTAASGLYAQGQHHQRLHFGLGSRGSVAQVDVQWFGTSRIRYSDVAGSQHLRIMHLLRPFIPPVFRSYHFRDDGCSLPGQRRLQPSFFVLGQPKCGTSSLAAILATHPLVRHSALKELNYFPYWHQVAGLDWYRAQFPCGSDSERTFDATPTYLSMRAVPPMLTAAFPQARLVVVLRDPVDRSFSLWRMRQRSPVTLRDRLAAERRAREGHDPRQAFHSDAQAFIAGFEACVLEQSRAAGNASLSLSSSGAAASEDEAHDRCVERAKLLGGGLYSVLIARWLRLLANSSQLLVLDSDQLNSRSSVLSLLRALQLERPNEFQLQRKNEAPESAAMLPDTQRLLQDFFRPFNRRLAAQLSFVQGFVPSWLHYGAAPDGLAAG